MGSLPRLGLVLSIVAVFGLLCWRFPYVLQSEYSRLRLLYLLLFLLAVSGSFATMAKRRGLPRMARDGLIWIGLILALVLGYSFKNALMDNRLMAELMPQHVRVNADGTLEIRASEGGAFFVEAQVNGAPVRFMVDTGASDIVLTRSDAARAGIAVEELSYSKSYATANGYGRGASITLGELKLGTIILHDIPASVNGEPMDESLLGMAFLRRLNGFRVIGSRLILNP